MLRQVRGDQGNLVSLDADCDVMRFVTGGYPPSREEESRRRSCPRSSAITSGTRVMDLGAVEGDREPFRMVPFWPTSRCRSGQGGLRLPAAQVSLGQGICHRGLARADPQGLHESGVQRVTAEAMAVESAPRRSMMEKAGLKLVDLAWPWPYPINGDQFGGVEYALDRPMAAAAWPPVAARPG